MLSDIEFSLAQYLSEISKPKYGPINNQKEIDTLAKNAKNGDETARNKIVEANQRLVVDIAFKHYFYYNPLFDLIQEGNIGLINAASKYDYKKGIKFSTYATRCIRTRIDRYIKENHQIRYPEYIVDLKKLVNRVIQNYIDKYKTKPSIEEVSAALREFKKNISSETIEHVLSDITLVSLHNKVGTGKNWDEKGSEKLLINLIKDNTPNPELEAIRSDMEIKVAQTLDDLDPKSRFILLKSFGFEDGIELTNDKIAKALLESDIIRKPVSRETVRKEKNKILKKLKLLASDSGQYKFLKELYDDF